MDAKMLPWLPEQGLDLCCQIMQVSLIAELYLSAGLEATGAL